MKNYIDGLTNLNNMAYLYKNYGQYIKKNTDTYTIAIDFAKLKYINDNFGHAVGDVCLQTFSKLIKKFFNDSLVIRRSGDEFVIVTNKQQKEIENIFDQINEKIVQMHDKGKIPIIFFYNCGIKSSENSIDETLYKADITMYSAKKKGDCYNYYNDNIYQKAKENDDYIVYIDNVINNNLFTYILDDIYDSNKKKTNIKIIDIRDNEGNPLFNDEKYELIKNSSRIKKIDTINIENIIERIIKKEKESNLYFINVNFKTILAIEFDFVDYLFSLLKEKEINPEYICLCINISGMTCSNNLFEQKIINLKNMGIKIAIDDFSINKNQCVFSILNQIDIEYIKINKNFIISSDKNKRSKKILNNCINLFLALGTKPILGSIDSKEELNSIGNIYKNSLIYGMLCKYM